jgi:hypothetical protein
MKTMLMAASAAAIALSAGLFSATQASAAPTVAGPKQPIPYSELNAYLKASPRTRAHKDWWSGQQASNSASTSTAGAETGAAANTSATAPSPTPSLPSDTTPSTTANPPSPGSTTQEASPQLPSGPVNPPAAATPGAPNTTTPPK